MTQRIPPQPQPFVDHIAGLLVMLDADKAGEVLASAMYKLTAVAIDKGWPSQVASEHALDFGTRVIAAVRQPRPLQ
jgi:hypothetical protein